MTRHLYFDHNATTPVEPRVRDAMLPYLSDRFGNPSSITRPGREAKKAVEEAREAVARLIEASPDEIVFTSGGTEAINLALLGNPRTRPGQHGHVITVATEHPATLASVAHLEGLGFAVTRLAVTPEGRVPVVDLEGAMRPDTVLVAVMLANNETGTIQPVGELARLASDRGALFACDAVQAIGKIRVPSPALAVDYMALAGHKFYAPKGVGALYVKKGSPRPRLLFGGHQEGDMRPGTENVAGIVGLGEAARSAREHLAAGGEARQAVLRDHLWSEIQRRWPAVRRNGDPLHTLPNTLHVSFPGQDGESLVVALDLEGVHVSAGSACASGAREPSHVLTAMGIPRDLGNASLRLSLGRSTAEVDVDEMVRRLATVMERGGR